MKAQIINNSAFHNPQSTLPPGWRWVRLGEVAKDFINGGTPNTNVPEYWDGGIPWITGADVTNFHVSKGRKYITEEGLRNSATHLVPKDTVLIVTRTGVGKVAIAANDICFSQDITGVICGKEIHPEYLARYILSQENNLVGIQRGATIKGLTRNDLENLDLPLPPIPEQHRIAGKIQELMQEVEHAKIACEKQLEAAKALPAAYLREVFESEGGKKWERKKLGEVCETTSGGTPYRGNIEYFYGDIPWVKSGELKDGYINDTEEKITKLGFDNSNVKVFPIGTLLVAMYGATVGKLGILEIAATTNQAICAILPNYNVLTDFLFFFFLYCRKDLINKSYGGAQPNISQEIIRESLIPMPATNIQQRIVAELKEKMSQVKNLQSAILNQQFAIETLPQAILRKAFRGEL